MWAGGSLRFLAPLHVGEVLTRYSEIVSLEHKQAGATPMAVLTLRHRVDIKRQNVLNQMYRDPAKAMELRDVKPGQGL